MYAVARRGFPVIGLLWDWDFAALVSYQSSVAGWWDWRCDLQLIFCVGMQFLGSVWREERGRVSKGTARLLLATTSGDILLGGRSCWFRSCFDFEGATGRQLDPWMMYGLSPWVVVEVRLQKILGESLFIESPFFDESLSSESLGFRGAKHVQAATLAQIPYSSPLIASGSITNSYNFLLLNWTPFSGITKYVLIFICNFFSIECP